MPDGLPPPAAAPSTPAERPVRDCQHVRARHEHGTRLAYVLDRCRCPQCSQANRIEAQRRSTAIAYGTWTGLVDAAPVRAHVQQLRAAGVSLQRLSVLSGVGYGALSALVYGDPSRGQPPSRQVRSDTRGRLLAVRADTPALPAGRRVPAVGTRRRLQALAAVGWSLPVLALRVGRTPRNLRRTLTSPTVTVGTARSITVLYDELRHLTPPRRTPQERAGAEQARTYARQHGWLPPRAWDDIDSDPDSDEQDLDIEEPADVLDEIAVERAMQGDRVRLTGAERDEAITRLTARGVSACRIAELLGTSSRAVTRRRAARRTAA
ncbi:MAG: zonular occludens toxin domain-containing protein [Actinomycetota bacterium]|nr:zonular occludens toxin domain-containing protein [Actinomycetota bacterium]